MDCGVHGHSTQHRMTPVLCEEHCAWKTLQPQSLLLEAHIISAYLIAGVFSEVRAGLSITAHLYQADVSCKLARKARTDLVYECVSVAVALSYINSVLFLSSLYV